MQDQSAAQKPRGEWDVRARACEACGEAHGSVNVEMNCLRKHLREARDLISRRAVGLK